MPACEPRQDRKVAALSSVCHVPQVIRVAVGPLTRPQPPHPTRSRRSELSYQVLARKWRPQRFDEVVGQKGVTQTLRNAIATGRIAQAFVFAGAARRRQDDDRPHPGPRPQLREGADRRAVRRLRRVRRNRRRPRPRRARDRRRHAHRRRQRPRGDHRRPADRAGARSLQGLHHRRGPPALDARRSTPSSSRWRSRRRTSSS